MGYMKACINLANLFERGNKKLDIKPSEELHREFKLKAFYHTSDGVTEISSSIPKAGETY